MPPKSPPNEQESVPSTTDSLQPTEPEEPREMKHVTAPKDTEEQKSDDDEDLDESSVSDIEEQTFIPRDLSDTVIEKTQEKTKQLQKEEEERREEIKKHKKATTGRLHREMITTSRRPPESQVSLSKLFSKAGHLRVTQQKQTFGDVIKDFFITKEMTNESEDMNLRLRSAYTELLLLVLYITCLLIIVYGRYNYWFFYMTNSIKINLEQKFLANNDAYIYFKDIKSVGDVWAYFDNVVMPFTYNEVYYHPKLHVLNQEYKEKLVIYENILVGSPRIRLLEVKVDECSIPHAFRRSFRRCYAAYSEAIEKQDVIACRQTSCKELYFKNNIDFEVHRGKFASYSKNGYEYIMPRKDSHRCQKTFVDARENKNWITRGTRVIFIDYLLYNANVNLFCKAKVVFELPPTGGVEPMVHFRTVTLFPYLTKLDYIQAAFEIILFFYAIYYILEEIREWAFLQDRYLAMVSSYIDMILCVLAFCCAIYTISRMWSRYTKIARACRKGLVSGEYWFALWFLDEYIYYEWMYMKAMAILIFLANLKFTRFLHFSEYLSTVLLVLRRCFRHCVGLLIMFVLVFFSFTNLGYFLFGANVESFSTYSETTFTLISLCLGEFDYKELEKADRYIGPIYLLFFVFLVYFTLLNMFLAVVKETYMSVRLGRTLGEPPRIPMFSYIDRFFFNVFQCLDPPSQLSREKREAYQTIVELKDALIRQNFTISEVNMLLAKYGIDNKKEVAPVDIHKILKDLESKGLRPTRPPRLDEIQTTRHQEALLDDDILKKKLLYNLRGLSIKDYDELMHRLDEIQKKVRSANDRLVYSILSADRAEKSLWSNQRRLALKKRAAIHAAQKKREEMEKAREAKLKKHKKARKKEDK